MLARLLLCSICLAGCAAGQQQVSPLQGTAERGPRGYQPRLFAFLHEQQHPSGMLESYRGHAGLSSSIQQFLSNKPAFVYDNALAALAFLSTGKPEHSQAATGILDALVQVQLGSGAVPDSVRADNLAVLASTTSSGNQAWVMLALITGHEELGNAAWLAAAERIGQRFLPLGNGLWNTDGFGGFFLRPGHVAISTENNLDLVAAFERLVPHLPGPLGMQPDQAQAAADHARIYCESRFDPATGRVWTGGLADGLPDMSPVPLDTHSWGALALGREKWTASLEWAWSPAPLGLLTTSSSTPTLSGTPVVGTSFSDEDTAEVWIEGLAQMQIAARRAGLDAIDASARATLRAVQSEGPNTDGEGLVAGCAYVGTGFGWGYENMLHIAPTSWAVYGDRGYDPFWGEQVTGGFAAHPLSDLPTVTLAPPTDTYTCVNPSSCQFAVQGTTSGVYGVPGRQLFVLIQPTAPSAGGQIFTQLAPATVHADGTWFALAELGDAQSPPTTGDEFAVTAIVIDGLDPPPILQAITPATIPGLVTVSGRLAASICSGC